MGGGASTLNNKREQDQQRQVEQKRKRAEEKRRREQEERDRQKREEEHKLREVEELQELTTEERIKLEQYLAGRAFNSSDGNSDTPLFCAIKENDFEMSKYLIKEYLKQNIPLDRASILEHFMMPRSSIILRFAGYSLTDI